MFIKTLINVLFLLISISGIAQDYSFEKQRYIDSLNNIISSNTSHDTAISDAYVELAEAIYLSNLDTMIPLCNKTIAIVERGLKNNTTPSIKRCFLKIKSRALHNIAYIYKQRGAIAKALTYYHKSLKIREENNDTTGMATSLTNLGVIYLKQGDTIKALDYYSQGYELRKKTKSKNGMALSLNNIGYIYRCQGKFKEAMELYTQSLALYEDTGDKRGIAMIYNNIGSIYDKQGNKDKALSYFLKSLEIKKEIGYQRGVVVSMANIGNLYFDLNQLNKAKDYGIKSLVIAKEIGYPGEIEAAADLLSKVYEKEKNYRGAFEMFKLRITMRDSILSEKNQGEATQQKYKYAYEKQVAADSIKAVEAKKVTDAQIETQKAQIKQAQIQQLALFSGVALLILFGGFMYNRFRISNKQKQIIEEQKIIVENARDLLEEKNTEITDSIQYAKRIQNAILPSAKIVKKYLNESFILYKPKDIVAGDFYWMEIVSDEGGVMSGKNPTLNIQHSTSILFAAADCTGHGVPGAMVSVICNNALNKSVREYGLLDVGAILDKTREIVIQEFEKSDEEVKDGMDIALCSLRFNVQDSKLYELETRSQKPETVALLQYAGAHNPLWIIRSVASSADEGSVSRSKGQQLTSSRYEQSSTQTDRQFDLIEIKADKQPIGKFEKPTPYTTNKIELQKGDSIYIFSDGYIDQFGGDKGKKFKAKSFKELILSIQDKSMEEQKIALDNAFKIWKGDLDQLDDVCIIGVKV
ncbi:MAG: tetratricopeptide repeat protein [Flavobacteriales bacterium]|nr:tetratricopeptide repeat protein [Flavobacteriales bacterium]